MKNITFLFVACCTILTAQIPAGYYNSANGLTGFQLKSELNTIIKTGHTPRTYNELITVLYPVADIDNIYENDGTILDLYSERPNAVDSYSYTTGQNCGNVGSTEGVCYNREHVYPQGFFNSDDFIDDMRNDAHHVIPTDGFVNGRRSNFPFGMVGTPTITTSNGTKVGASITTGFNGTVFEPIDEFKGDIARMLLYFATRYDDVTQYGTWGSFNNVNDPRDGSIDRWYEQWYVNLLLDWHAQDPVSQREINRNNAIFTYQGNRNPYIDNPQYVAMIWTNTSTPSGSMFATLVDTFVDVDGSNSATVGDRITYNYSITNLGNTTLFNIAATPDFGTFMTPGQVAQLAANQTINNPFGVLTHTLSASDLTASCNCFLNRLNLTANLNAAGTNGSITGLSDDPDNFANNDSNGDSLPDDFTRTNLPGISNPTGAATDLFISEYIEGSSNNKAIEIANFTGATIDLSSYSLQRDGNGNGSWSGSVALNGSLPSGQVYVVARSIANAAILSQADLLVGNGNAMDYNGNDPVGLFKNGILLDVVGDFGYGGVIPFAENVTLVRKATVTRPTTTFNLTAEWNTFGEDDSSNLGSHIFGSTASITETLQTQLTLYPNPTAGTFTIDGLEPNMQVAIYDITGRTIHTAQMQNSFTLLSTGLYLVRIKKEHQVATFKVIVR